MISARRPRRVKGVNLVDLIKILKVYRRKQPLVGMRPETLALLDEHVLPSNWYPLELHLELLLFTFKHLLHESEEQALQMGFTGARLALTSFHKAFIKPGDPLASTLAMRHLWASYFDFGALHAESQGDRAVRFTVTDYPDMPLVHGVMIAGWHMTAPELAGATKVTIDWLERPWKGAEQLSYIVRF